jgi:DNA-binding HxlR family transcriptional regulator
MGKRSYGQFSALAIALDVVGERWTLLIVRDLFSGPKRFTDLQSGLPGISANLLSRRLKDMEKYDIVSRSWLPPPAASAVYELTRLGTALEPVLTALEQWGTGAITLKPDARQAKHFKAIWALLGMKHLFNEEMAGQVEGTFELTVDDQTIHVTVHDGVVEPKLGPAASPTLSAHMDLDTFKKLMLMEATPVELLQNGKVQVVGSVEDALKFYELFLPALHMQLPDETG